MPNWAQPRQVTTGANKKGPIRSDSMGQLCQEAQTIKGINVTDVELLAFQET